MTKLLSFFLLTLTVLLLSCGKDSTPTMPNSLNQMSAATQMNPSGQPTSTNSTSTIQPNQGQGADNHSEQIIFSGEGDSPTLGHFGFWIWSQDEDANSPEYAGEAAGAITLFDQHKTSGVGGDVEEISEGIYQITMDEPRLEGGIQAIFTNEQPVVHGPHNVIDVQFLDPVGTGQSTNAVVNVTGPSD